ncbi:MAG: hypothetical protein A2139_02895 [Desulfobacca sp. RBG_16_60_12]|nr:MAG: hypothetical protein A2139_02895 [Desulfobacca sp. RBG_16_60_12]
MITHGVSYLKDRFQEFSALRGEKAAAVKQLSDLKELLSEKQRKAVDKGIVAQATVVQTRVLNKERVDVKGELCGDWIDKDGRFNWHAAEGVLDVNQVFDVRTSLIEVRQGRVYADTEVWEVSPKTGLRLKRVGTAQETLQTSEHRRKRQRSSILLGAQLSIDGITPFLRADYRLFGPITASVEVSNDIRAFVGWRHEF